MTKVQAAKLRRLVNEVVKAQLELSWAGSLPPEEWPHIEKRAGDAERKYRAYIKELVS